MSNPITPDLGKQSTKPADGTSELGFTCNLCGCNKSEYLATRADGQDVVICSQCEMGVLRLIPEDTSIFYEDSYYKSETKQDGYTDYEFTAAHSLLWLRFAIEQLKASGTVLDVGCANGYLLAQLSSSYGKYGIEVNPLAMAEAEAAGLTILSDDIFSVDAKYNGRFDVVTSIATLEHVKDFRGAVEKCLDLLKPDGFLIFEVPLISATADSSIWFRTSMEHVYYPTVRGLEGLFQSLQSAQLVGLETIVRGFGPTFVGIASKSADSHGRAIELIDAMRQENIGELSEDAKVLNLAFSVVHQFAPTSEKIAALPLLLDRGVSGNVIKRLTQLWYADHVNAFALEYECSKAKEQVTWLTQQVQNWMAAHATLAEALEQSVHSADAVDMRHRELESSNRECDPGNTIKALDEHPQMLDSQAENFRLRRELNEACARYWAASSETSRYRADALSLKSDLQKAKEEIASLKAMAHHAQEKRANAVAQLEMIETSTIWRGTRQLRRMVSRYPFAAKLVRRSLKLAWWTISGQLPERIRLYTAPHSSGTDMSKETAAHDSVDRISVNASAPPKTSAHDHATSPFEVGAWPDYAPLLSLIIDPAVDDPGPIISRLVLRAPENAEILSPTLRRSPSASSRPSVRIRWCRR
jgi:SAM-dependent methyltransferase